MAAAAGDAVSRDRPGLGARLLSASDGTPRRHDVVNSNSSTGGRRVARAGRPSAVAERAGEARSSVDGAHTRSVSTSAADSDLGRLCGAEAVSAKTCCCASPAGVALPRSSRYWE
jgi:hypothetical protein